MTSSIGRVTMSKDAVVVIVDDVEGGHDILAQREGIFFNMTLISLNTVVYM